MKKVVEKEEEIILITKTSKGLSWKEYHFIHEDFSLRESEFFQKQKFMQRKKEIFIFFFEQTAAGPGVGMGWRVKYAVIFKGFNKIYLKFCSKNYYIIINLWFYANEMKRME